jgi:hypothetical protein
VAAELERLGTAAAVAAVGVPEIRVDGTSMRVALRGLDGKISGVREIAAPTACAERATVAAVLVSAWVGAWPAGALPEAARMPETERAASSSPPILSVRTAPTLPNRPGDAPARAARTPLPALPTAAPLPGDSSSAIAPTMPMPVAEPPPARTAVAQAGRPVRPTRVELGGFGFGIHDGDAGAFGGGIQAGYRFPHWLGLDAVLAAAAARERAMVRGSAAYRQYSLGVGLNARKQSGRVAGDLGVLPEVTILSVEGRNLNPGRSVTRWGAGAATRVRLALVLGPWRPFAFAGASFALRAERLRLDDYPARSITLSRWSFTLGLGLSCFFGAANPGETNAGKPSLGLLE